MKLVLHGYIFYDNYNKVVERKMLHGVSYFYVTTFKT